MIVPFAVIGSYLIIFTTAKKHAPFPTLLTLLTLLALFLWTYFLVRTAVGTLRVLSHSLGINVSLVAMIAFPAGCGVPVVLDKLRMAALGLGDVALVGCFASQVARLSLGFFISFFKSGLQLYFASRDIVEQGA